METLATLTARHTQIRRIDWIGLRPARLADMQEVPEACLEDNGLKGDHARPGKRALTLIQAEHLAVMAALAGTAAIAPETLRRNLVVSRLNLGALRGTQLHVGEAMVEITGPCAPCARMEAAMGPGGYTAMRGHGDWCAKVLRPGMLALGDPAPRLPGPKTRPARMRRPGDGPEASEGGKRRGANLKSIRPGAAGGSPVTHIHLALHPPPPDSCAPRQS